MVLWSCCRNHKPHRRTWLSLTSSFGLTLGTAMAKIDVPLMRPLLASTMAFTTFFKCFNIAGIGDVQDGVEASLVSWMLRFLLVPEPVFLKGKLQMANRSVIQSLLWAVVGKVCGLTLVVSLLQANLHWQSASRSSLLVCFLHTWTTYLFAGVCLDFSALVAFQLGSLLVGHTVLLHDGLRHPLRQSRTFREAWETRWNDAVQRLLQHTVYVER